jgi:hypothetical protein
MVTHSCRSMRLAEETVYRCPETSCVISLARYMIRGRNEKSLSYFFFPGSHFKYRVLQKEFYSFESLYVRTFIPKTCTLFCRI